MGWRVRKSVNLGLGFRINLSKSGIGYSWGGKGFRITKKADGGTRTTYSIPGTGISYVEETGAKNFSSGRAQGSSVTGRNETEYSGVYPVVNGKIETLSTPENQLFIKELKSKVQANFITKVIGGICIFLSCFLSEVISEDIFPVVFLAMAGAVIALVMFINSFIHVNVEYDIDEDIADVIEKRNVALAYLCDCEKIWQIEEYSNVSYIRVNAGAATKIKRKKAKLIYGKAPKYLKIANDTKVYQLSVGKAKYIFLPDKIIVVESLKVGAMKYGDIEIDMKNTNFVEESSVPADTNILRNTWKYVNNNGTPDRRFKNNMQLPVCEYKIVYLRSNTGLNVHLLLSSANKAEAFKEVWDGIDEIL